MINMRANERMLSHRASHLHLHMEDDRVMETWSNELCLVAGMKVLLSLGTKSCYYTLA
jgi:hypothetical protein